MSVGYQSFYQAQLTAGISDTDTDIPLDVVPTVDEGFLVIESTVPSKREIIYFTSKTSNSVVCPSGAGNGRGYDGTTAVSHLQGAAVIMAPVGAMFSELRQQFTTTPQGWTSIVPAVNSVTDNGNNSYTLNFASAVDTILSEGMRARTTRNSAAGVTCFSLDGSNDYLNKTSPAGMTFTDDFTVSAWIYLTSYAAANIVSRFNGTSGWRFFLAADGTIRLQGFNGGAGNYRFCSSYQSIPLNKWVHVAAQLDMSTYTVSTTTCYVMINGKDVPAFLTQNGTNPTALVQAGNLEIGSENGGASPFPGYIDQVAIYSAKVTQATILASRNQPLTGSEANLISAYSGANTTDLNTTNANNLTAQNGAVTGFASAPWGNRGLSTTLDYGLVMAIPSSTSAVIQVPEGCTIPTTGGVSAVAYSVMANPFGFVSDKGRWIVGTYAKADTFQGSAVSGTWYSLNLTMSIPTGNWLTKWQGVMYASNSVVGPVVFITLSTADNSETDSRFTGRSSHTAANNSIITTGTKEANISLSTATTYYINTKTDTANTPTIGLYNSLGMFLLTAHPSRSIGNRKNENNRNSASPPRTKNISY
jgi:hypothetical protein